MTINTGKTPITITTLAAILSLSLVVNLPGLAVTPMLSTLSNIFPGSSETEKQLLTIMPNVLIIPFVLLSGKLSLTKHKIATIVCGLVLFVASGIAYFFAHSMTMLIVISCLLGCGAGLIIPFAAGLIADCFVGKERVKMMGMKSGTSNLSLVVATFAVGWLSSGNWHLPFIVYLVGLIPLFLSIKLKDIPAEDLVNPQVPEAVKSATIAGGVSDAGKVFHGYYVNKLMQLIGVYFFITFTTMIISYYLPFLIQDQHLPDTLTGTITAIFYLFIFLPGFFLTPIVRSLKGSTFILAGIVITLGLAVFVFMHQPWAMCIGGALAGLGYGISQPLIYDKASRTVNSDSQSTMALAIVLAANYVSISLTPVFVDLGRCIFHTQSAIFPFVMSLVLMAAYVVLTLLRRQSFAFAINKAYY